MIINIARPDYLQSTGIYKIENLKNGKYYIGSTSETFCRRFSYHISALRRGSHKNAHLQNAFNKYNEDNFQFLILERCLPEKCLEREQVYLDKYNDKNCYNINPMATGPCKTRESIEKQLKSRKIFMDECLEWYKKLKQNDLTIDNIPKKFINMINMWLSSVPWNKGIKYESTDHLKVPHKSADRTNAKLTFRKKYPEVYIYDKNQTCYGRFRSYKDLEELSEGLILPIKSRFAGPRMGKEVSYLSASCIGKSVKTGKPYKGLYFTNKPLHQGIDDRNEPKSAKIWNDTAEVN
jgi:group I intron endonuclease